MELSLFDCVLNGTCGSGTEAVLQGEGSQQAEVEVLGSVLESALEVVVVIIIVVRHAHFLPLAFGDLDEREADDLEAFHRVLLDLDK